MNEQIKALFAVDDLETKPLPWLALVLALCGLLSFLAMVGTTELAQWMTAGRAYSAHAPSDTIVYFVAYAVGVHVLLAWPVTALAYPQFETKSACARLAILVGFAALPLFSFAGYLGGAKDLLGWHEVLLSVLPAAILAAHFFLLSGKTWVFTLTIVGATFVPFWIANDILSGFPVLLGYASKGGEFYFWRAVAPIFTTAAILYVTGKSSGETKIRAATLAVMIYGLILYALLPVAALAMEELSAFRYLDRDIGTALFFVASLLLWKPSRLAYFGLIAAALAQAIAVAAWLTWYATHVRLVYSELFRVSFGAALFALAVAMILTLATPAVRAKFLR